MPVALWPGDPLRSVEILTQPLKADPAVDQAQHVDVLVVRLEHEPGEVDDPPDGRLRVAAAAQIHHEAELTVIAEPPRDRERSCRIASVGATGLETTGADDEQVLHAAAGTLLLCRTDAEESVPATAREQMQKSGLTDVSLLLPHGEAVVLVEDARLCGVLTTGLG